MSVAKEYFTSLIRDYEGKISNLEDRIQKLRECLMSTDLKLGQIIWTQIQQDVRNALQQDDEMAK